MTNSANRLVVGALSALVVGLSACSSGESADLRRDLDMLGSNAEIDLAPSSAKTDFVSDRERFAAPNTKSAPSQRASVPRAAHVQSEPMVVPEVAASPEVSPAPAPQPSVTPSPSPAPSSSKRPRPRSNPEPAEPPGGYKTVEEVIRNAPFPINP